MSINQPVVNLSCLDSSEEAELRPQFVSYKVLVSNVGKRCARFVSLGRRASLLFSSGGVAGVHCACPSRGCTDGSYPQDHCEGNERVSRCFLVQPI